MGEDSLRHGDGKTAEEEEAGCGNTSVYTKTCSIGKDAQEWNPAQVVEHGVKDVLLAETVFEQGETNVAGTEEDDGGREPDLERVHVESVDLELEAEEHVVDDTDGDRGRDTVCRIISKKKIRRKESV
jgi:hypothetical protein